MGDKIEFARVGLASLVIFRGILADPAIAAFRELVDSENTPVHKLIDLYSAFVSELLKRGGNWSEHLLNRLLCDENQYVLRFAGNGEITPALRRMLESELAVLEAVGRITCGQMAEEIGSPVELARWETSELDYKARYMEYAANIGRLGYGIFAEHHMFLLEKDELIPVRYPDTVDFERLVGYERERELVAANTLALLEGKPAANVLLYGDSGTGKSTCVKAVANEFGSRGLRLIELRKEQLGAIPSLIDRLSNNPLKFILFIDDLSFTRNSDNFSALKAVLEGSVSAKSCNMAIYATSNRRHLIRERFSEREGDDVHVRDTIEELASLSDRFGLTVTFTRPDRELYISIVKTYMKRYGVAYEETDLLKRAEAFALERGGRSARAARQFAESEASKTQRIQ